MFEPYFGFSAAPFQLSPDPSFFYGSRGHKRAHAYLQYGLYQSEGFPLARIDPLFPTGGPGSDSLGGLPEWLRMDELHQHFRQANALPAPLSADSFSIPSDVALKLLGKAEAAALLTGPGEFGPEGAFASFYGRFPGSRGLVSFSRVGFSRDMTQAVVYTESGSTAAPEGGGFVFLRRLVDRWIIVYHMPAWVI